MMGVDMGFRFSNGNKKQCLQNWEHVVYRGWNILKYCHIGSLFCELWVQEIGGATCNSKAL